MLASFNTLVAFMAYTVGIGFAAVALIEAAFFIDHLLYKARRTA